jgi:hypothetical protein
MDEKLSAPSVDADINAPDAAIIRIGVNTATINTSRKTEELLEALKSNRKRLKDFKDDYVKVTKADGGIPGKISGKRRTVFYEIMRTHGAMEALKNEMTQRGAVFEVDVNDHEHPNAAYKRLTAPPKKADPFDDVFWYIVVGVILLFLWFVVVR